MLKYISFHSFNSSLFLFLLPQYCLLDDQLAELAGGEARLRDSLPVHSVSEPQSVVGQSLSGDDGPDQLVGSPSVFLEPTLELNLPTSLVAGRIQDLELDDFELNFFSKVSLPESTSSDCASFNPPNSSAANEAHSWLSGSEPDILQLLDDPGQMAEVGWDLEHLLANC